jgi:SAM-dependent methyltransferase
MNEISRIVDQSANFYNNSFLQFDYRLAEFGFQTLRPYFKGKLALELGPSSGYMTKSLIKEFETLHLVEGSENLLSQIPDYPNIIKYHSLFEDYDTDNQYDTIIMSHVLEHISDPILVLKKIYNWLKVGGVFCVAVPNAKSIHRLVAKEMGLLKNEYDLNQRDIELGHYRVYDLTILKEHVLQSGFKIVESGGYFLKPLSNGQIESYWSAEMIQGFYKIGKQFQDNCAEIFVICSKE